MKKSCLVLLSIFAFFFLNSLCKKITDDFSLQFLTPPAPPNSSWSNTPIPDNLEELIAQEYLYLGKGKQAYAFLSKDGKHVLKLFKPAPIRFQISLLGKPYQISLSKLPFIKSLFIDFSSPHYQEIQNKEFRSYVNAVTLLPQETKVEYVHLASTQYLQKKLTLYDKIGVLHTIDLDNCSFLIQKKADLFYPTLLEMIQNKEKEKAQILLRNFISFYLHLIDTNIVNPTTVEANIGCLGLEIVQIDVGRLLTPQDLDLPYSKVTASQLKASTSHMKKWLLRQNATELHAYFIQMEEEMLSSHTDWNAAKI